jgi:hypothetical protein
MTTFALLSANDRTTIRGAPASLDTYASQRPSGEIAGYASKEAV